MSGIRQGLGRARQGGVMKRKRWFWLGVGCSVLGVALIVWDTRDLLSHGLGIVAVVLGLALAIRHSHG